VHSAAHLYLAQGQVDVQLQAAVELVLPSQHAVEPSAELVLLEESAHQLIVFGPLLFGQQDVDVRVHKFFPVLLEDRAQEVVRVLDRALLVHDHGSHRLHIQLRFNDIQLLLHIVFIVEVFLF